VVAVERAVLAEVWAEEAAVAAEIAVESALAASAAALVPKSTAVLTALGVAASVVEVLEVLVLSLTTPVEVVEAELIDSAWGNVLVTTSGAEAVNGIPADNPGEARVTLPY
jgi:hypothetical protein